MTPRERQAAADAGVRESGVLVIGAGVAGLSCALAAAPARVTLVTKTGFAAGGNSVWAQGGMAAAVGEDDSGALHARDTLAAGAGLCDARAVDRLVSAAAAHVAKLVRIGTHFDRAADGTLALGREAAHSRPRILHANGDGTGAEIVRALAEAVRAAAHVTIEEHATVEDLLVDGGRVTGAWTRDHAGRRTLHLAHAVVLATGGLGQLFRHTTNPPEATGDGVVLAARAGAVLADLEFVQFHPTALDVAADPLPLVTEALRGAGALLVDELGRRFVLDAHPDGELAPRDVVARASWAHRAAGHRVLLDARGAVGNAFPVRFPAVFDACRRHGLDPRVEPIPVTPAAHYHMGGVHVDGRGRSSLPGLWACGEVACTGVHGANRLASNSLLEALVFGAGVADDIRSASTPSTNGASVRVVRPPAQETAGAIAVDHVDDVARVRHLMWDQVGLVRTGRGLESAVATLRLIETSASSGAARDLALLGRLLASSALARKESRGGHYRADLPESRDGWAHRSFVRLLADGRIQVLAGPPVESRFEGPRARSARRRVA